MAFEAAFDLEVSLAGGLEFSLAEVLVVDFEDDAFDEVCGEGSSLMAAAVLAVFAASSLTATVVLVASRSPENVEIFNSLKNAFNGKMSYDWMTINTSKFQTNQIICRITAHF